MGYKAVIFDLDGTLVDTLADLANSMNFALESLDLPTHSTQRCAAMISRGIRAFAENALGPERVDFRDEVIKRLRAHYIDNCLHYSKLYDDIQETVDTLKATGLRLAVLTNKDQNAAQRVLGHFFKPDTFECIVGVGGDIWAAKPDNMGVKRILSSMGLKNADCLLVGDSEVDIETAQNSDLDCVAVSWGYRSTTDLIKAGAKVIIDRPEELLALLP